MVSNRTADKVGVVAGEAHVTDRACAGPPLRLALR